MAAGPDTLLRYIRGLVLRPKAEEFSDAALLSRFIKNRDESAFAALVDRHGALVLHVCHRLLGDFHDTEDAFQATFLVLARKAATVRRPESLAAWLHGVARRAAIKARSARQRVQTLSCQSSNPILSQPDRHPDPPEDLSGRESLEIIDEELERLPEVYRLPVILCGLESRSLEEAARQLGWTVGSVKGRLERGRARLHARLVRRGATLSAVLTAAEASREAASAAVVVARLLTGTVRRAVAFGAGQQPAEGVSAGATTLAQETLKGMARTKLKIVGTLLLVTSLLSGGLILRLAALSPPPEPPRVQRGPMADIPPVRLPLDPDAPIHVSGRVLDTNDMPIAEARLYVGFLSRTDVVQVSFGPLAYRRRATSGKDGEFSFTFTQSELNALALDQSSPAVIAVAQKYGAGWAMITASPADNQLILKLPEDFPVEGRILNRDQQPVANTRVSVWEVGDGSEGAFAQVFRGEPCISTGNGCRGPLPEQPQFLTTAADGSFRLNGFGRDRIVTLVLEGPDVPRTFVWAATRPRPEPRSPEQSSLARFDYVAPVSRRIRGRVRDKATGQPVAGVKVTARPSNILGIYDEALTDDEGCYEILSYPREAGWIVQAQPQSGQPYFAASHLVADNSIPPALAASTLGLMTSLHGQGSYLVAGALCRVSARAFAEGVTAVDFDMVSGIRFRGKVTDQANGKPPTRAMLEYYPLVPNPHSSKITYDPVAAAASSLVQPDGSYSLVVLPGPGVVCATAWPRYWYAGSSIDEREFGAFLSDLPNPSGGRLLRTAVGAGKQGFLPVNRYHILSLINVDERAELPALNLNFQRAQPDAQPR